MSTSKLGLTVTRKQEGGRRVSAVLRRSVVAALAVVALQGCASSRPVGGPYYYRGWNDYSRPYAPAGPVAGAAARALPQYGEAFFDSQGRILRFIKHVQGVVISETTYDYPASGGFVERICWDGKLLVTAYDPNKGGQPSSRRGEGGCAPEPPINVATRSNGP
jgi:hypothetical protein